MKILTAVEVALFLSLIFLGRSEANAVPPKPKITDAEVLSLFRRKQQISNRTISPQAIENALKWAQEEAAAGRADQLGNFRVTDSVITGKPHFGALKRTPFDKLSEDLKQRYMVDLPGISLKPPLILIPVKLEILSTVFEEDISPFGIWDVRSVVFQEPVDFSGSEFKGYWVFPHYLFQKRADFTQVTFNKNVSFWRAEFQEEAVFSRAQFQQVALFERTKLGGKPTFSSANFKGSADFAHATFQDGADFSKASFHGALLFNGAEVHERIVFDTNVFLSNVYFIDINARLESSPLQGELFFNFVKFSERSYFTGAKVKAIWFSPRPATELPSQPVPGFFVESIVTTITFEKYVTFRGLRCNDAVFIDVEFQDFVDFGDSKFENSVSLAGSNFERDVSFSQSAFPFAANPQASPNNAHGGKILPGLVLDNVRFQKPVNLEWNQLNGKLNTTDKGTWELLESSFKQTGNLEGKNEAMYKRRTLERQTLQGWANRINRFESYFWGYGVRPSRVVMWIIVVFLGFTTVYWTQTRPLAVGKSKWQSLWHRLIFATGFSTRTSWKWGYGYQNSRTPTFKALTLIHSISFKVLLLCLLKAFSNTSPLLNELVGKLVRL